MTVGRLAMATILSVDTPRTLLSVVVFSLISFYCSILLRDLVFIFLCFLYIFIRTLSLVTYPSLYIWIIIMNY